jgi:hypothetical protein
MDFSSCFMLCCSITHHHWSGNNPLLQYTCRWPTTSICHTHNSCVLCVLATHRKYTGIPPGTHCDTLPPCSSWHSNLLQGAKEIWTGESNIS